MTWSFTLEGQPPSWNHSYHDVIIRPRNGVPFRTKAKTSEALQYQNDVGWIVRTARPSGWVPTPQVRLIYDFAFGRPMDADNAMKMLNDAVAHALGIDDKTFLPCARSLTTGNAKPSVTVTIEDV